MIIYIALALSLAGSVALAWASVSDLRRGKRLGGRVDMLLRASGNGRPATEAATGRGWFRLDDRMRELFTYGIGRSWGMSARIAVLLPMGLVSGAVATGTVWLLLHVQLYLAIVCGLTAFLLIPRLWLRRQQKQADAQFGELLPDAIDMVVRMVRAGLPVAAAIRTVGREADWPANWIFSNVADLAEIGIPLSEALAKAGASSGNPDFRFFGVAVALQQSTGGNLAITLETLSEIIRKRRAIRLKARAATSEIRISAIVLAAIPFFIVGALLLVSPGYLEPLLNDPRGNIIAGSSALSLVLAGLTMRAMMRAAVSG